MEHSGGNKTGRFCHLPRAASQILLLFPREVPVLVHRLDLCKHACGRKTENRQRNGKTVTGGGLGVFPQSPPRGQPRSGGGWKGPSGHQKRPLAAVFFACPERGSNPHVFKGHWILSPARLPIPPSGQGMVSGETDCKFTVISGFCKIFPVSL